MKTERLFKIDSATALKVCNENENGIVQSIPKTRGTLAASGVKIEADEKGEFVTEETTGKKIRVATIAKWFADRARGRDWNDIVNGQRGRKVTALDSGVRF